MREREERERERSGQDYQLIVGYLERSAGGQRALEGSGSCQERERERVMPREKERERVMPSATLYRHLLTNN